MAKCPPKSATMNKKKKPAGAKVGFLRQIANSLKK
jgi:hypothetical protein